MHFFFNPAPKAPSRIRGIPCPEAPLDAFSDRRRSPRKRRFFMGAILYDIVIIDHFLLCHVRPRHFRSPQRPPRGRRSKARLDPAEGDLASSAESIQNVLQTAVEGSFGLPSGNERDMTRSDKGDRSSNCAEWTNRGGPVCPMIGGVVPALRRDTLAKRGRRIGGSCRVPERNRGRGQGATRAHSGAYVTEERRSDRARGPPHNPV